MKPQASRRSFAATLVTALFCLLLTAVRSQPPRPKDPNSEGVFSAVSAGEVLEELYADGVTHPIGTENNRRYKERILEHLRDLGYDPIVQQAFVCRSSRVCGHVENILARLEGTGSDKAALLAVHYDSVGAGPSVSDDGVAVAASLEIARVLKEGPPPANDVIFLIDDGEEHGLLGAIAFAAKHPWAEDVGAVVNLEARGTAGRSYMFETGTDNAWLIDLMKRHVPHPASSSLFYSIYQRLPNDTDFTIFKEHGMNGVNFAFIKRVVHYHTPLDNLDHVTPATLQHQGENALGMTRALMEADLSSPPTGTASWFDLWGFGVFSWPETWNLPLSVLAVVLGLVGFGIRRSRRQLGLLKLAWGTGVYFLGALGATALAAAATWYLRGPGSLPDWPATAWAPQTGFWLIGISVPALVISFRGCRAGAASIGIGACIGLGLLAVVASTLLPGAAYLFLVPAVVGGGLALLTSIWRAPWLTPLAYALTLVAACATQLNMAWNLWEAMGITIMPVAAFFVASITTLVLAPCAEIPKTSRRKIPPLGLALAVVLVALSPFLPAYSEESPRPVNFYFLQDADTEAAMLATHPGKRPLPDALANAVDWNAELENLYPWDSGPPAFHAAVVDTLDAPSPQVEILEEIPAAGSRRIRAVVRSPRHADQGALVFHQSSRITSLILDDWELDLQTDALVRLFEDDLRVVGLATFPDEGIEMTLVIRGDEPLEVTIVDSSFGLPPAGEVLSRTRSAGVVPIGRGDRTIVFKKTDF